MKERKFIPGNIFWKTYGFQHFSHEKKTDDIITMCYMMNVSINKTHILVKIMFASNLIWNLCIFGNEINSEYLGIPIKTFVLTKKYVVYVYDTVNCL